MRRTARLFALAEALRARRTGVTAEQLAAELGVSVRTIYRDLDALREASLPIAAERGRGGGYALDRTYSLPPVNFTAREAMVLLTLGRLASDLRLFPFTRTLGSSLAKVRAALPTATQRRLDAERHRLSFTGVPAHESRPDVRAVIEDAWFEERPLELAYRRADGSEGHRRVRITGLVLERSETLINTEDLETGERRQLRLHRVERATALEPVAAPSVGRVLSPGAPPRARPAPPPAPSPAPRRRGRR